MRIQLDSFLSLFLLIIFLMIAACNNSPRNIPFPQQESEYTKPITEKLIFSEPQKIDWRIINRDSVKPPQIERFNLGKIASKQIDIGNPVKVARAYAETSLDWNKIPDTTFNLDNIPAAKLRFRTGILGQPKRTKSGLPRLKDGATENLLQFGMDQGLSGTIYTKFIKDKNGILWIATDDGLCSFDGEYCENYSLAQGLNYNWLYDILIDSHEQLWISYNYNRKGVTVINRETGIIRHITTTEGLNSNNVRGFVEDNKGRIWVSTDRGLNVIDQQAGTIRNINKAQGLSGNSTGFIFQDRLERIWTIVNERTIDIIDERTGSIKHLAERQGIGNKNINYITEDKLGRIWLGTDGGGVISIDEKAGNIIKRGIDQEPINNNISCLAFDEMDRAWIGIEGGGVQVYDLKDSTVKHLSTAEGLNNNNVYALYADNQHQVWIGMNGGEANIYNTSAGNIRHLSSKQGLSNKNTFYYGFAEDANSRKWVSSSGGVDIIDENNGTIKNISAGNGLSSNYVNYLFTDSRGRIWIKSNGNFPGNKLDVIDEKNGTKKSWGAEQGLLHWGECNIYEDKQGQIWTGGPGGGIFILNEETGIIKNASKTLGLKSNNVASLLEDTEGQIWMGTDKGVDIINEKNGTLKSIIVKEFKEFPSYNLFRDSQGNIWIGTNGEGLLMANPRSGTLTKFTVANGLAHMVVYTVNERNGSIYAATGKGLTVLTPTADKSDAIDEKKSWQIKSYGKPQGFLRIDHNPRSLLAKDGKLWFGIADVLTIMGEPQNDSLVSPTYISSLDIMTLPQNFISNKEIQSKLSAADTIWNKEKDTFYTKNNLPVDSGYLQQNNIQWDSTDGPYNLPVNLKLPYNQNHLTFHFTGTHLDNMNKTRYRYVLEGTDRAWSDITDKAYAEYRNLSFGKYSFKVSSAGFNGRWSQPAVFNFTILPPWWLSAWAYIFYGLCLVGLTFMADRIQRRRLVAKERERTKDRELAQAKEIEKAYTELKTTQAQLIQAEKMASLGELTAGIAHEIQNPLNFVNNFSEVNAELIDELKEDLKKGNTREAISIADNVKQNNEKITYHGKRADSIVKGMLQHSRNGNGKKEPTDINTLADECLRLSYHGMRAKDNSFNIRMETHFDSSLPLININSQEIGRVLLNLFTNAFYSLQQKKKQLGDHFEPAVTIKTIKTSKGISIIVNDNGNGIPQKAIDKIFQPFFTTKPTGEGTGLGLSMSYDIITKGHGGELKVETKEGEFAEFIITLPL